MSQKTNEYIDEYQNVHMQGDVLGQGGQGVVFRTKDPDLAIKLVTDENGNPITAEHSVKKYSKRFKRVRLLPLPESLNISLPVALLNNNAGYVMQLLSDMVPLSNFWLDGKAAKNIKTDDIPKWLSKIPEKEAKEIIYYYKTGGLRRRLNVLYKCASLIAQLHGKGMVYGDISCSNVFISEEHSNSSVWLIDADNIRFEITSIGSIVYTPRYGAPELVQGKDGGRPTSDCHAFGVVAFYLLSLIHPFLGKKVDGTDEGDWADTENDDEDIEEKAYAGLYPWVDDQSDDSNSSGKGLPRSLILTKKLISLFEGTFGPGRLSPPSRPAIYHWPEALAQAADTTVACPNCRMNYYYDFIHPETDAHNCPYCKAKRPQVIILESHRWNAKEPLKAPCWRYVREFPFGSELTIPRRVFDEFSMLDSGISEMSITLTDKDVLIKRLETGKSDFLVATDSDLNNTFQKLYSQMNIDREAPDAQFWVYAHLNSPRLVNCKISGA